MATVTLCDHFIATVGTFSWWAAWLTGGNVTYYKWPAREGTRFRKSFSKDYKDHYYPHWIGL
jgi:galactoside 2-L-fucosyltransferase 1/2